MVEDLIHSVSPLKAAGYDLESLLSGDATVLADPARLLSLYYTGMLDSPAEEAYDRIAKAVAGALGAPSAALSLVDVDRQFLKSVVGTRGHRPRQGSGHLTTRSAIRGRSGLSEECSRRPA